MAHFAFLKEIFFGLGDFFTWGFQILPIIGDFMNVLLTLIGIGLLVYWCIQLSKFGQEDKRLVDYRKPHNYES